MYAGILRRNVYFFRTRSFGCTVSFPFELSSAEYRACLNAYEITKRYDSADMPFQHSQLCSRLYRDLFCPFPNISAVYPPSVLLSTSLVLNILFLSWSYTSETPHLVDIYPMWTHNTNASIPSRFGHIFQVLNFNEPSKILLTSPRCFRVRYENFASSPGLRWKTFIVGRDSAPCPHELRFGSTKTPVSFTAATSLPIPIDIPTIEIP